MATAAAGLGFVVVAAAPAWACGVTSPGDTSCGLANVTPANAPRRNGEKPVDRSGGAVGALVGDAPATVTPDDGYAPEDTRILHRRHHHRRHTRAE